VQQFTSYHANRETNLVMNDAENNIVVAISNLFVTVSSWKHIRR